MKLAQDLEVLIQAEKIAQRVREIGAQIERDYANKDLVLLGVLKGSYIFISDLARAIDLPLAIDFIGLSSYGEATESSGVVKITSDLSRPIEDKHVVIVEDIVDTARCSTSRRGRGLKSPLITWGSRSRTASWSATASTPARSTATSLSSA